MKVSSWTDMDSKKKTFILIAILVILGSALQNRPTETTKDSDTIKKHKEENHKIEIALVGASMIKKSVRNPDSFKASSVIAVQDGTICYEFRAQNGYGGMNTENAILDPSTLSLSISGSKGFVSAWNKKCAGKHGDDLTPSVVSAI